jgi:hypothetical protein
MDRVLVRKKDIEEFTKTFLRDPRLLRDRIGIGQAADISKKDRQRE